MVRVDDRLDYATHELKVNALMKEIHKLLLNQEYVAAASTIDETIVELRFMRGAVKSHIQE